MASELCDPRDDGRSTLLATRAARRRSIVFIAFLAVTLVLMAVSSNQLVRDFQSAMSFALRPVQGALDGVASGVAGVVGSITEIERLHSDNTALRAENERLTAGERAGRGDRAPERPADRAPPAPERVRVRDGRPPR